MVSIHSEDLLSSRFFCIFISVEERLSSLLLGGLRERKGKASKQNWLLSFFFLTLQTNSLS